MPSKISVARVAGAAIALSGVVSARHMPYRLHKRQGTLVQSEDIDFGDCSVPQIEGGLGFDGRREFSFQPVDRTDYPHSSAQNIGIITQFICDTLVNSCGATTAAHDLCVQTEAAIGAGKDDGGLADDFNAAFGIVTDFANAAGSSTAGGDADGAISATGDGAISATSTTAAATATAALPVCGAPAATASSSAATVTATAATTTTAAAEAEQTEAPAAGGTVDTGSCPDPTILFTDGLSDRQGFAFVASSQEDFPHGSALNIGVIVSFITQRLETDCDASQAALDAAAAGARAAQAAGPTTAAAAEAWNAAFGF